MRLHKIKSPTLVIKGENDTACNPRLNKFIADQIPNSKLVILSNYKHALRLEAPKKVTKNMINFFNNN